MSDSFLLEVAWQGIIKLPKCNRNYDMNIWFWSKTRSTNEEVFLNSHIAWTNCEQMWRVPKIKENHSKYITLCNTQYIRLWQIVTKIIKWFVFKILVHKYQSINIILNRISIQTLNIEFWIRTAINDSYSAN